MMIRLGDMTVIGKPPAKLAKALAVIADTLHPSFNANPRIKPDWSKRSCVMCSLTVREFLTAIGFADATVMPVRAILWARLNGKDVHSLGIGLPPTTHKIARGDWAGHMIVTAAGYLIDTTLYQAVRPQWLDLTGMAALPLAEDRTRKVMEMPLVAGAVLLDSESPGYEFNIAWGACPNPSWRNGPDARDRDRRVPSVQAMMARFGKWDE
jgi:hypothetical protein